MNALDRLFGPSNPSAASVAAMRPFMAAAPTCLRLPTDLRHSLACTNIIENMNGTIRRICCNVKRWWDAAMALCWTGAP